MDLDKFPFADRPRGKNIAYVGYLSLKKNPMFLLQCFRRLLAHDGGYRLFFAGKFQEPVLEIYMHHMVREMGLAGAVRFDGWQTDVSAWLEDKHYIACPSVVEGHPVGIMEAMARGLAPAVHNFPGASDIYPREFIFNDVDEFCDLVVNHPYEPARYREFVEAHCSLGQQNALVEEVLAALETNPVATEEGAAAAAGLGPFQMPRQAEADKELWTP